MVMKHSEEQSTLQSNSQDVQLKHKIHKHKGSLTQSIKMSNALQDDLVHFKRDLIMIFGC